MNGYQREGSNSLLLLLGKRDELIKSIIPSLNHSQLEPQHNHTHGHKLIYSHGNPTPITIEFIKTKFKLSSRQKESLKSFAILLAFFSVSQSCVHFAL